MASAVPAELAYCAPKIDMIGPAATATTMDTGKPRPRQMSRPIRTLARSAALSPLATANSVKATLPGTMARNDVTMNAV